MLAKSPHKVISFKSYWYSKFVSKALCYRPLYLIFVELFDEKLFKTLLVDARVDSAVDSAVDARVEAAVDGAVGDALNYYLI